MLLRYNAGMQNRLLRSLLTAAVFVLFAGGAALAQSSATPAPKAPAKPLSVSGFYRAYYFTRTNLAPGKVNQASFNNAVNLHAQYDLGAGLSVGGSYLYANPFNNCNSPVTHIQAGPCKTKSALTGTPPATTWDDTLPAYRLSTLYEAYLQYKTDAWYAKLGDQVITTPWANASDSRLKPVAFRGGDLGFKIGGNWSAELMDMTRFEDRVQSDFVDSTLVSNTGIPKGLVATSDGFAYGRLGYAGKGLAANLHYYAFQNIANALWFDGKYAWKSSAKPFFAVQFGSERSSGSMLAGKIDSQVAGAQIGASPWSGVDLSLGFDYIPQKSDTITLPAFAQCQANNTIKGILAYFLPGTPNCQTAAPGVNGATATVYYGGWASPYTDSYATDPLFTTSISQGMADRRSSGTGVKVAGTFYSDAKQIRLILSHAWYRYGYGTVGFAPTQETNVDGTYFFSRVGRGAYHGFSLRHRYAERTTGPGTISGALPDFKYNRTQLEYDF